jgi:hypothetical protein
MKKLLAALALMTSPAYAEPLCIGYPELATVLASDFSKQVVGRGLSFGTVVETWVNLSTGSWMVVMVGPSGIACIAGHGTNWETYSTGQPS